MTLLALEFSSESRSVALVREGRAIGEATIEGGRATPIFRMIRQALDIAKLEPADVEGIAVGIGPGSYTGIRRAIAAAQGWHLATGIPITAVNSLDAIAHHKVVSCLPGDVWIAVDAQRQEAAVVQARAGELLNAPSLVSFTEIRKWLADGCCVVSPDAKLLGDGAVEVFPTAEGIGRLADASRQWVPSDSLAPIYLRADSFVKASPVKGVAGVQPP